jgi:hypothetical protein
MEEYIPKLNPRQESIELSSDEKIAVGILWKSYEFSQGDSGLQMLILNKLRSYFKKPLDIDIEKVTEFFNIQIATKPDEQEERHFRPALSNAHEPIDTYVMRTEVFKQVPSYLKILTSQEVTDVSSIQIATNIWSRDYTFFVSDGRNNRLPNAEANTLKHQFFSFGVQYLIREHSSYNAHIDKLLNELRGIPFDVYESGKLLMLYQTINMYNLKHPKTPVPTTTTLAIRQILEARNHPVTDLPEDSD